LLAAVEAQEQVVVEVAQVVIVVLYLGSLLAVVRLPNPH
jgi:hypothetical protein